jgi:hypothetical protein
MFIGYFLFDGNIEMPKHKKSVVINHYLIRYWFYLIIILFVQLLLFILF